MAESVPGRVRFGRTRANNNGSAPWTRPGAGPPYFRAIHMTMFDDVCSWENLLRSYQGAARGKRGRPAVAAFELALEDNLVLLTSDLQSGRYRPGPYASFSIHEPKRRLISAAPFRDRVVHHALCNVIEPVFERRFVAGSFANRVGKGTHRAIDLAQSLARRYRYVLQADVQQFLPSVDHAILREELARVVKDPQVLQIADAVLRSGEGVLSEAYDQVFFPGDDLFAALRPRGLPIGNLTSQFWANVYMNPFDHFVTRELRCAGYVRYVDDVLLYSDHKDQLWTWLDAVRDRLARLRLTIHGGAHPRPVAEGFPFLGFVVSPLRRRLRRHRGIHFQRRLASLIRARQQGELSHAALADSILGWTNHARFGNTVGLRKSVLRRAVVTAGTGKGMAALKAKL
jgi:RNA-directed DNA polymerase